MLPMDLSIQERFAVVAVDWQKTPSQMSYLPEQLVAQVAQQLRELSLMKPMDRTSLVVALKLMQKMFELGFL